MISFNCERFKIKLPDISIACEALSSTQLHRQLDSVPGP